MAGNSFGQLFKVSTFGESHGGCVGVVIDGCPPGLHLDLADVQRELDRRRPGQSRLTTTRQETDQIKILSGVFEGQTTGTPLMMMAYNNDMRPEDYQELGQVYRPSHADYTYEVKYGRRDWRGSGRASARETLGRVAAGAVARKILAEWAGIEIVAWVERVGDIKAEVNPAEVKRDKVDLSIVRCPDLHISELMEQRITAVQSEGDSIGGIIAAVARGVPAGLGEPVFDRLSADLAKAMLSINAVKGFEIGSGFAGTYMRGSEHNDSFMIGANGEISVSSNNAGGVLGGISSGAPVIWRTAFKPVATIAKPQATVNRKSEEVVIAAKGRHDPCVLPRAVPIVEAMAALVFVDHWLRQFATRPNLCQKD